MRNPSSKLVAERDRAQTAITRATAQRDRAQAAHATAHEAWRAAVLDGADSTRLSIAKSHTLRQLDDANAALIELHTVAESIDERIAEEVARAEHAVAVMMYAAAVKAREGASESLPNDIETAIRDALAAVDNLRDRCAAFQAVVEAERQAHAELATRAEQIGEPPPGALGVNPADDLFHGLIDVAAKRLFNAGRNPQRRATLSALSEVLLGRMNGAQPVRPAINLAQPPAPSIVPDNVDNRWLLTGEGPHGLNRPPLIR
jgi:hypothetical protein